MPVQAEAAVATPSPQLRRWRAVGFEAAVYLAAVLAALLVMAAVLVALGINPVVAYSGILRSSLGSMGGIGQTMNKTTPLLLGGLAVAFAMRGSFLNIGVDGQVYLGAVFATGLAFLLGNALPPVLAVPLVLLAGFLGGAVAMLPAAMLRARWEVNEIFVTVMMNFIVYHFVDFLTTGPWNDPMAGEAITRPISANTHLPMLMPEVGGHSGILLALAITLGVGWVLRRTMLGFQIRALGDNPVAARLGGIDLPLVGMATLLISGALAGVAGAIEVAGYHWRLILGLSPNYGLMAILLAVLGKGSSIGVAVASAAFAALLIGSDSLQRSVNLPASAALLFQAVVLLAVLGADSLRGRGPIMRLRG